MVALSVLIPTYDPARPLKRCLRSIASQPLLEGDEVIVIGDTRDGDLPSVEKVVADFGAQFRYIPHDGGRMSFGHDQINHGITLAAGDLIIYQDDDDVFSPDVRLPDGSTRATFAHIRAMGEEYPGRPLLFRFVTRFRTLVWGAHPVFAEDHIGGHCFVVPNRKEYLAPWTERYQGDWDHIKGTIDLWPGGEKSIVWREEVIALARPNTPEDGS